MANEVPPLRMNRLLLEKAWGGRRLHDVLGIPLPDGQAIGESWELADHDAGMSETTWPTERPLRAWLTQCGDEILGEAALSPQGRFPLLCKYLHAKEPLSVQVHPNDAYAGTHEGDWGKTEAWYVLDADPDAWIIAGFRDGVTREELAAACADETIADLMVRHDVKAGDLVFLPAGTVHTIGPGIVLAEVQQSSDVTYRFYDWGRTGRALHVRQGLEVADLVPHPGPRSIRDVPKGREVELVACDAFRMALSSDGFYGTRSAMPLVLMVLDGSGRLLFDGGEVPIVRSETWLIPARCRAAFELRVEGEGSFLWAEPVMKRA